MGKYLIFLVGLLVSVGAMANCEQLGFYNSTDECSKQLSEENYREYERHRAEEQSVYERTRPITVIEPHGVTTLYPSMDGSTYQSYSIGRRGQD
jgi:hypothetical protein